MCYVDVLYLLCNFDILADWRVDNYKFIMTTLILKINKVDDVRLSPPRFLVDVSTCFDVITRHRHIIVLFYKGLPIAWCPSTSNEDDLAGKSRYTRFWCP